LFNANFLQQNNLLFEDSRKTIGEDLLFSLEAHYYSKCEGFIEQYLYCYHMHPANTSLNHGDLHDQKKIAMFEHMYSFLVKSGIYQEYQSVFIDRLAKSSYSIFRRALRQKPLKEALQDIRLIKKSEIIKTHINLLFSTKQWFSLLKKKPMAAIFLLLVKLFF
jgi:hypothetical protein